MRMRLLVVNVTAEIVQENEWLRASFGSDGNNRLAISNAAKQM